MKRKYVAFRVGEEQFGIGLEEVAKIIRLENVTDVPAAPSFVEGVLNLGGDVVPVVNLRGRFSLPRLAPSRWSRVIVVEREQRRFGVLVDGVREILELDDDNILTEAVSALAVKSEFVLGIAKIRDDLLVLLDIFRVLSAPPEVSLRPELPVRPEADLRPIGNRGA